MTSILSNCASATCCIVSSCVGLAAAVTTTVGIGCLVHASTLHNLINQCCTGDNVFNKNYPCPDDAVYDREVYCVQQNDDASSYTKIGVITLICGIVGCCLVGAGCCLQQALRRRNYSVIQ